ncbi:MAG TPA: glycosyltransferase family 4 protein [bacterium]|nr:glycosyltransferase family 4 protein [bacterium]HPR87883.1 glycosyltransferase family 4 protein [bacterium]
MKGSAGRILIIVQNLPVPLDRRVWLESTTLRDAGYQVSVICPASREYPATFEVIEGITIRRYRMPFEARGVAGYAAEFIYAWLQTARLSLKVLLHEGFEVLQACNPPDTYFLLGWIYRLFGKEYVFDHHDLAPEMYSAKFNGRRGLLYYALLLLEKMTLKTARVVLVTNESYRESALKRGRKHPDDVFVLRTGPDLNRLHPVAPDPALKAGRPFLVCYLGEMCPQDGVDYLLHAAHYLRYWLDRRDVRFVLIGGGPAVAELKKMNHEMGMEDFVHFTGRISDEELSRYLSTADVCVDPDPWSEWANNSTMNKILEYMVFARPIVAFDLKEIHYSARRAALYARPNDVRLFAQKINVLLDHPEMRTEMGAYGRQRVVNELAWSHTHPPLLAAYARIFNHRAPARRPKQKAPVLPLPVQPIRLNCEHLVQ